MPACRTIYKLKKKKRIALTISPLHSRSFVVLLSSQQFYDHNICAREVHRRQYASPRFTSQAKTRSLVVRIDRLETIIEKQQERDLAHRALAARAMLKHHSAGGLDGASRNGKRLAQVQETAHDP